MDKIQCDGFTLEVVKVKGGWAQKATVSNKSRYRFYHYKKEAVATLSEWVNDQPLMYFMCEFNHNFSSADELGIGKVRVIK